MVQSVRAVPEGSLLVHIGPQKTGSTAIQRALHAHRADLAELGVHYPGPDFRLLEGGWAAMSEGAPVGRRPPRPQAWDRVVAEMRASTAKRRLISTEDWGRASQAAVDRIVADLGAEDLHVVYVARRLDRLLPSHWQERVKARMTKSWEEFVRYVVAEDHPDEWEWAMMWDSHDAATVLGRWARHVDPDRIIVLVADEGDHSLLPRTFERLLDVPEGLLEPDPADRSNRSLTYPEVEALRRVNQVTRQRNWSNEEYWRIAQVGVGLGLSKQPAPADSRRIPGLPEWALPSIIERCARHADAIAASPYRVIGDPDRLRIEGVVKPDAETGPLAGIDMELLGRVADGLVTGAQDLARRRQAAATPAAGTALLADSDGRTLLRELAVRVRRRLPGR